MPAPKGHKRYGGRAKGVKNKKTREIQEKLEKLKCDPLEGMAKIADEAMQIARTSDGREKIPALNLAGSMYKELAQYEAPKRKAIEHSGVDGAPIPHSIELIFK